jgi:hypothetical protein
MKKSLLLSLVTMCAFLPCSPVAADDQANFNLLQDRLDAQQQLINAQQKSINQQSAQIQEQQRVIDSLAPAHKKKKGAQTPPQARSQQAASAAAPAAPKQDFIPAPPQEKAEAISRTLASPTAATAEEPQRPQIEALADQGGLLSPKGMLTYENTVEYTNTTRNLFTFNGVELAQVVLVGALQASSVRHDLVQNTARLRLGLTNKLEADIRVPYVYRNDAVTDQTNNNNTGTPAVSSIEGNGIGDIDAGLAYQFNQGTKGWPFLIGNLRYKANNADGPYDVPYNAANVATRLPTGTGFQTVEASVTAIKVTDPAVLFGNLGYVYDMSRDINKNFSTTYVGKVEPGDAINALVGMAFAVNQDVSFSLGYKHSYVFSTTQHSINTASSTPFTSNSGSAEVGALMLGLSYAATPTTSLNFNVEAGVTNDAPDVHLSLRIPFEIGKVF